MSWGTGFGGAPATGTGTTGGAATATGTSAPAWGTAGGAATATGTSAPAWGTAGGTATATGTSAPAWGTAGGASWGAGFGVTTTGGITGWGAPATGTTPQPKGPKIEGKMLVSALQQNQLDIIGKLMKAKGQEREKRRQLNIALLSVETITERMNAVLNGSRSLKIEIVNLQPELLQMEEICQSNHHLVTNVHSGVYTNYGTFFYDKLIRCSQELDELTTKIETIYASCVQPESTLDHSMIQQILETNIQSLQYLSNVIDSLKTKMNLLQRKYHHQEHKIHPQMSFD